MSDFHTCPLDALFFNESFIHRHLEMDDAALARQLEVLGAQDLDAFVDEVVPQSIRLNVELNLPAPMTESDALAHLDAMTPIRVAKSYIGQGYWPTRLPYVIERNVLQNPGWYTAYTPYQAEIAQGRLEALLNFQQMCVSLTGLDMAGASLLDEATAAAEAMAMAKRASKSKSMRFFVDERTYPQTLDVLKTRAEYFGFELLIGALDAIPEDIFGAYFQYIGKEGDLLDLSASIEAVKSQGAYVILASDILSLALLKSPGALGADIALGSTQRFGIPMGFGGPHAAYFAFCDKDKRLAPGRIIGVSRDKDGNSALRMALQTREQHIRREKANSNICTSQVLLANLAGMYAVYHGPLGIKRIATRINRLAQRFAQMVDAKVCHNTFFDTVALEMGTLKNAADAIARAKNKGYNLWQDTTRVLVSFSECSSLSELDELLELFGRTTDKAELSFGLDNAYLRQDDILTHPVFNRYHTEHKMLRYLKSLEDKDLAMNRSMISLGSCTMKLNATAQMLPISWDKFANVHPFAPEEDVTGYIAMINDLADKLKAITGFDAISMQPNSGASGEYAGLLAVRRYQASLGQKSRNICLIPRSAHGTNPATAQMIGLKVVAIDTDANGNVDLGDLDVKIAQAGDALSCLMITYPSTHGVFEEGIRDICQKVHDAGGQVYMDGANMNAQVGLMRPADVGADVLHMNLHKTFCIPHGGGGPGMGPIGVKSHLEAHLPGHTLTPLKGREGTAVSAAAYGSASILPISWMYIALMGAKGLTLATKRALLNANYIAKRLEGHYPILYTGKNGRVAHECIIDIRPIKEASGITESDIAKRLMDYGFHAPTMSFPVAGTLMIEPTESEALDELDRFVDALIAIKGEIDKVQSRVEGWTLANNPLVNAPHTALMLAGDWDYPYSKETAVYPLPYIRAHKFFPSVRRVDDVYGDKNLICTCPSMDEY